MEKQVPTSWWRKWLWRRKPLQPKSTPLSAVQPDPDSDQGNLGKPAPAAAAGPALKSSTNPTDSGQLVPVSGAGPTNRGEPDPVVGDGTLKLPDQATSGAVPRDPGVDLAVAKAVLAVARRLTSAELQRRLTEAVRLLPDVTVVFPVPGDTYDPGLHTWESSVAASASDAVETIAETRSAGLVDHRGTVHRRASVVVYDTKENQS
jgi:hypothetical protein